MRKVLGLVCLMLSLMDSPAQAQASGEPSQAPGISLYVEEKEALRTKFYKEAWTVPDILGHDASGKPYLKLFPAQDPQAKQIVDLLNPGVGFAKPQVRDDIAEILDGFPWQCKANMELILKVNPIEDIDLWVEDYGGDNRRITIVSVNQCLKETPKACRYCLCQDGGYDFPLGSLKRVLRDCQQAIDEAVKGGAEFANPLYSPVQSRVKP